MPKIDCTIKLIFPAIIFFAFFALVQSANATNGNDSWTGTAGVRAGTTMTGPWKTINKVNVGPTGGFQAGDDVYFKCGETWVSSLSTDYYAIPASGAGVGNPAVIGAYYMVDNVERVGIQPGGNRPVLDGNFTAPPSGQQYRGMIYIAGKSDITIQDIAIIRSNGAGIAVDGPSARPTIKNCLITNTMYFGIHFGGTSAGTNVSYGLIENNGISYNFTVRATDRTIPGSGSVTLQHNTSHNIVKNNRIHNCYGECLDVIKSASYNTIDGNTIYAGDSVLLYLDRQTKNNVVKNNLVYCTTNPSFRRPDAYYGIDINYETTAESGTNENNYIYNNIIAGCRHGMLIGPETDDNNNFSNQYIYNNIIIDSVRSNFYLRNAPDSQYVGTVLLRNNMSVCVSDGCSHYQGAVSKPSVVWSNNLWGGGAVPTIGTEPRGVNDIVMMPILAKSGGWQNLADGELNREDAKYSTGDSAGVNAGHDTSAIVTHDIFGTSRPVGAAVDIGAHEYDFGSVPDTVSPAEPQGLAVR